MTKCPLSHQRAALFHSHLQMWLFSKDVESSLVFEELSLQTVAPCRGRQILPCEFGAHVCCQRVLAESAAGAQAGPHACEHIDTNKSHTHIYMQETACSNATDVHMLSNKLRLNDEQHMTCGLRLHAQQYNRDYVNTFILSVHQQSSPLCESGVLRY